MAMEFSFIEKPIVCENSTNSKNTSEDGACHKIDDDLEPIDRTLEKKVVRKCDFHVLPAIALLYSLAFLDRINIGNARLQGLEKDLKMKGQDYNIALFVFFIPYILFEVPSNIVIRKVAPSTWLSSIMVGWGERIGWLGFATVHLTIECRYPDCLHGPHPKLRWSCGLQVLSWTV